MKHKIAVAASGSGRSLDNLIKLGSKLNFEVSAVILSRRDCKSYDIAKDANIPTLVESFPLKDATSLEGFLQENMCQLIVLAGFLRPFPILTAYENKILNIHPALLPNYGGKGMYGMNIHKAVLEAKEEFSGATVHLVNEEYDKGRKLSQVKLNISKCSSAEEIAKEIFSYECSLLPFTINNYLIDENFERLNLTEKELNSWLTTLS